LTVLRRLTLLLPVALLTLQPFTSSQGIRATLSFGLPIASEIKSGDVHEYGLSPVMAGDLVSGTLEVRGLAVLVEVLDAGGAIVRTDFLENPKPVPERIGFVAPMTGIHRLQIKAFDRFEFGPQTAPGEPIPVAGTATGSYSLRLDGATVAARMRGPEPPVREDYPSARLKRLADDLRAPKSDALAAFWREVAAKGPLVEDVPANDGDVDVTFLWREIYDTRNVSVIWANDEGYMSHLSGTDVWYKTVRLRRGTRIQYVISPNDRAADRWVTRRLDPLNPRKFPDDPTYRYISQSVLDMPGAPDEQWALRTPVRRGTIEEKTVASALIKSPGGIWIYTPPGYSPTDGPYPLVYLLDGAAYVSNRFAAAPATLDNLINHGRIRPAVVCFDARNRGANSAGIAGAQRYGDALVKETIPMLRASYAISTNPADVIIGGFSAGGRAAAQIALFQPDVFGNVLSQSGAFREASGGEEPNASARAFLEAPRKPIRFYLEVGRYDNVPATGRPLYELVLDETNLMGNRHLRDVLLAKGYDVIYREVGGGHDFVHWRAMLADGLMTLLKR
jgi:enterochelin esterase-like enzyme